ncbi:MAG: sulfatase-like hydrolase/transferase [Puniceicoccaceae bacterium]
MTVTPAGAGTWLLRWEDRAADEAGLEIERNEGNSWVKIAELGPNTQLLLVSGDTSGVSPEFRVRAFNAAGESAWAGPVSGEAAEPMNIIFLLADDMGYKDIVALREEATDGPTIHETPALDTLVSQAVTFTNAYASGPRCVVARRSLQTGMYDFRPEAIGSGGGIDPSEITVGEAMQAGGYRTCFIGKWHLGSQAEGKAPEHQGYDVSIAAGEYGAPNNSYFPDPGTLSYNLPNLGPAANADEYLTDRLTSEARGFISDHMTNHAGQPFFMILSHYAVHTPLEAKPADVSYFTQKRDNVDFSYHPGGSQLVEDYTADVRIWQDNIVYAAMMKSYDDSLAGLREELELQGIADRTIIVISSDHGGKSTFDADKNNAPDQFPTSNFPFRLGKTWCYDGGLRIPLIVYWPGVTQAGMRTEAFVHGADFYRTFLEMGSVPEVPSQHIDSISFLPAVIDGALAPRTETAHHFTGISDGTGSTTMGAYRKGRYKLAYHINRHFAELYDFVADPGETTDLFDSMPTLANEMLTEYVRIRNDAGVKVPTPSTNNWSTEVSNLESYMTIPLAPQSAPSSVSATPIARSVIDLSWTDNSSNETAFIIMRKGPGESYFKEIHVTPPDATSYRDRGLMSSSLYSYSVIAHNMGGWKTASTVNATTMGADWPMPLQATDDTVRLRASETRSIHVLLNDEGEGLAIDSVGPSNLATVTIVGNRIHYKPIPGKLGGEVLTYTVRDQSGKTDSAELNLTVEPEPGFPNWSRYGLLPGSVGDVDADYVVDRFDGILGWAINGGSLSDGASDNLPLQAQYRDDDYTISVSVEDVMGLGEAGINLREQLTPYARSLSVTMDAGGTVRIRNRSQAGSPALEDSFVWDGVVTAAVAILRIQRTGDQLKIFGSNDAANTFLLAEFTWENLGGHFVGLTGVSPTERGYMEFGSLQFRSTIGFTTDLLQLADGYAGLAYKDDLSTWLGEGGKPPVTFAMLSGPAWVSLSPQGLLSGTPDESHLGPASLSLSVTDADGIVAFSTAELAVRKMGSGGGVSEFTATGDTFINEQNPDTNYGSRNPVQVRDPDTSDFGRYAFFKYSVTDLSEPPDSAQLHLYVESLGYNGTFEIHAVENAWSEGTLTWNTAPVIGSLLASVTATSGEWAVADVSSHITGNGTYSFAITETTNSRADITARGSPNESFLRVAKGPLNRAPEEVSPPPATLSASTNVPMEADLSSHFTDPDADPLIFRKISGPDWLVIFKDGRLQGTPGGEDDGTDLLELQVADPLGASLDISLSLTVTLSPLDTWLAATSLTGLAALPQADTDFDGRTNVHEFWENTNPEMPDISPYSVVLEDFSPEGLWRIAFGHQTRDSERVRPRYFWSEDLSAWSEIQSLGTTVSAIDSTIDWSVESFQLPATERVFLRRFLELD